MYNLVMSESSFLQKAVARSIEGQDPSWKNVFSRRFVEFDRQDAMRKIEGREQKGFWWNSTGRKIVNLAVYSSGYILGGK